MRVINQDEEILEDEIVHDEIYFSLVGKKV